MAYSFVTVHQAFGLPEGSDGRILEDCLKDFKGSLQCLRV